MSRPRLLNRIVDSAAPVVVLDAPGGYGKSTLVQQLREHLATKGRTLGIECDVEDRDPETFLRRLVGDMVGAVPGWKPQKLGRWLYERLETEAPTQIWVIIDRCEVLQGSETERLIASLVSAMENNPRCVVSGRGRLSIGLPAMVAAGKCELLTKSDLEFSEAEEHDWAAKSGVDVSAADIDGWPAMLALRAQGYEELSGAYVAEEVLERLGPERAELLQAVVLLSPVPVSGVAEVIGEEARVELIVEELPLVYLSGGVVRCHDLWKDWMGAGTDHRPSPELRRKAARYLRRTREHIRAFDLLAELEEWDEAAEALRPTVDRMYAQHPRATMDRCMNQLPAQYRDKPSVILMTAMAEAHRDMTAALEIARIASAAFRGAGDYDGFLAALLLCSRMIGATGRFSDMEEIKHDWHQVPSDIRKQYGGELVDQLIEASSLRDPTRILPLAENLTAAGILPAQAAMYLKARSQLMLGHPQRAEYLARYGESVSATDMNRFSMRFLGEISRLRSGDFSDVDSRIFRLRQAADLAGHRHGSQMATIWSARLVASAGDAKRAAAILEELEPEDHRQMTKQPTFAAVFHTTRLQIKAMNSTPAATMLDVSDYVATIANEDELDLTLEASPCLTGSALAIDDEKAHHYSPWIRSLIVIGQYARSRIIDDIGPVELGEAELKLIRTEPHLLPPGWLDGLEGVASSGDSKVAPPSLGFISKLDGLFALRVGARTVAGTEWNRVAVQALLAMVSMEGALPRDTIAARLWPDLDPTASKRNLRVVLALARSLVNEGQPEPILVADRTMVRFVKEPETDLANLQLEVQRVKNLLEADERTEATAVGQAVLEQFCGELLLGLSPGGDEDWLDTARRAHARNVMNLAEMVLELQTEAGQPWDTARTAERLLRLDPSHPNALAALERSVGSSESLSS